MFIRAIAIWIFERYVAPTKNFLSGILLNLNQIFAMIL